MRLRRRDPIAGATSLARNTAAQASSSLLGYILSFISAPFVLNGLGLRNFGIWALTGALAQYGGLLDLGVAKSLVYFGARYESSGERRAAAEAFAVGACVIPAVTAALAVCSWLLAEPLARSVGGVSTAEMRFLLLVSVLMLAASMTNGFLTAYSIGKRRMVAPSAAQSFGITINFAFSVTAVLARPHDLRFYAAANLAASAISVGVVLLMTITRRMLPPVAMPTRRMTREVLGYSLKTQIVWLAALVNFQTDKIVIAIFVSPRAAGAYELANRVAAAARSAAILSISALVPTLAEELVSKGLDHVRSAYLRLSQRTSALSVPWLFGAAAVAPVLLPAWLGETPPDSVFILVALSLAYVANALTGASYALAAAAGKPGLPARAAIAAAVLNVVLTAALAPAFGTVGVLAGTFVALTLGALYQWQVIHRTFEISNRRFIAVTGPVTGIAAALAVPLTVASLLGASASRIVCAVLVIVGGGGYLVAYLAVTTRLGYLPESLNRPLRAIGRRVGLRASESRAA